MTQLKSFLLLLIAAFTGMARAQTLYFPPVIGDEWETISPASLGWCEERIDSMYEMLEENNTKAFIILKDGKIVLEKYFGTFVQDSLWYWASAGKSLTACLVGIAQQEGLLNIGDTTSRYLGEGWTNCTSEQEEKITIWHQLTMTSGLDDYVDDNHCTLDTCLVYKADAGTRWAYHNAPYTLLDGVIETAANRSLNTYFQQKIRIQTGINGAFIPLGYNNVFFSTPRHMARFGLMILNKGNWDGTQVLTDTAYFNHMVHSSQGLNLSYGYLWWLNGKASYMLPTLPIVFPGSLMPHAPADMVSALGKNGQYINVVPSQNLVLIRMGNAPDGNEVPVTLNDKIWEHINELDCGSTAIGGGEMISPDILIYPNPARGQFTVSMPGKSFDVYVYDMHGHEAFIKKACIEYEEIKSKLAGGIYVLKVVFANGRVELKKLVIAE